MAVTDGAAKGAAAGSFLGMPGAVAGAAIGGITSLIGGNKNDKAAKSAAEIQAKLAREALAEQRRVYDLEDKKERERYETSRKDTEYDRAKTLQDEGRVRASRQGAFGGFSADLDRFSQSYGVAAQGSGAAAPSQSAAAPVLPDKGMGQSAAALDPSMPQIQPGMTPPPMLNGGGSMGSTVWLQSPDGMEEQEVSMQDAPMMIAQGAKLIPGPSGVK